MNRSLRGWRALLATLGGLALFAWFDQRTVDSAPLHGIRPKDSDWVASTTDFPALWHQVENGDVFARMRKDWPRPQAGLELRVRQATGIRPTPARYRVWMGRRLTLAHSREGTGICVYPGLLLRLATRVGLALGYTPDEDGVVPFGDYFFTWRDSFLIVSKSRPYVLACLRTGDNSPLRSESGGQLAVQWTGPHEGFLRTVRGNGLRVTGRIKASLNDGERPLLLTNAWPEPPLAAVTARRVADLESLGNIADELLGHVAGWPDVKRAVAPIVAQWNPRELPSGWDSAIDHAGLVLLDIKLGDTLPIPDVALALRSNSVVTGPHPLTPLMKGRLTIPHEWQGQPGLCVPWLGEEMSPCLSQYGRDWIATLNEPAMAALLGALAQGPAEPADLDATVRVSWKKTAGAVRNMLVRAGQLELLPGMNGEEAQQWIGPKLDALSRLGTLRLDGWMNRGWLAFEGELFQAGVTRGDPGHGRG